MIVSMRKLTLVSLNSLENEIMKAIQELGVVEVIAPDEENEAKILNGELFSQMDAELKRLDTVAGYLKPYTKKPGLLEADPVVDKKALEAAKLCSYELCDRLESINDEITRLKSEITKKKQLISQLSDWLSLDTPLEKLKNTKHTRIICGYSPVSRTNEIYDLPVALNVLPSENTKMNSCIIAVHKSADEGLNEKLREFGFVEVHFPAELHGTAREITERIEHEVTELEKELEKKTSELKLHSDEYITLLTAKDAVNIEYDRLKAMAELLKSKSAFILEGWVREPDIDALRAAIDKITDAYYLETREPSEGEDVPISTDNNKLEKPFESIVDMYSKPAYGGIDATPFMTPFYMLFFGMMLADAGYGLLLFFGLWLFEKLKKPRGGMKGIVGALKWSGAVTFVCGILFGAFFGVDLDVIFGTKDVFPLIMDPMDNVMTMLLISCGLGLLHMLFGIGIKIYMCLRDGDVQAAIFDNLSWIFLIVGIVGFALTKAPYNMPFIIVALLGAMLIIVFGGRNKKGIMRIFGGFGSLYNLTSWLSDTVSYARIFALGLVGGAMGSVFNMIGSMIGSGGSGIGHVICLLLAAVVLAVLHAFSLFINTLSAFAHTARLQYVEFFGKFYEAGGRAFNPLSMNTKSVVLADASEAGTAKAAATHGRGGKIVNTLKKSKNK